MDTDTDNDTITVKVKKQEMLDQFAKLMLGAAAGFIASKMAENAYDNFVVNRRNKTTETQ